MSLEVVWNPPDMADTYLQALNTCFPGWGDAATYEWCFQRSAGAGPADLMVLYSGGRLVAGSGVSYRMLETPQGQQLQAGIMTGSWTFAEARGQGCFTRVIQASVEACVRRGAAVLLAFVTETNPSCRRLAAAGSGMVPAWYLMSTAATPVATAAESLQEGQVLPQWQGVVTGAVHFVYREVNQWEAQFIHRPHPTRVLASAGGCAVLEETDQSDRIQFLQGEMSLESLLARAQARDRQLFLYSTRPTLRDAALAAGLSAVPGYLTVLAAHRERLSEALRSSWDAADSTPLADPHSPLFLGPWAVHTGDRM